MQSKLITVKPHPSNSDGWVIYEGEKMAKLLNNNFFIDKNQAENVARARRHVYMQRAIRKLTGMNVLQSIMP